MCVSNFEYQLVNPTTQVSLMSICFDDCNSTIDIHWNIYQGFQRNVNDSIQWIPFNQTTQYQNIWFFGIRSIFPNGSFVIIFQA